MFLSKESCFYFDEFPELQFKVDFETSYDSTKKLRLRACTMKGSDGCTSTSKSPASKSLSAKLQYSNETWDSIILESNFFQSDYLLRCDRRMDESSNHCVEEDESKSDNCACFYEYVFEFILTKLNLRDIKLCLNVEALETDVQGIISCKFFHVLDTVTGAEYKKSLLKSLKLRGRWLNWHELSKFNHNSSTALEKLNLENNDIGSDVCRGIANNIIMSENAALSVLNLSYNDIRDEGMIMLSNAIFRSPRNSSLKELNLSSNNVTGKGTMAFFNALQYNESLTTLRFASNQIGCNEESWKSISNAFSNNNTLKVLDLQCNEIRPMGCQHIFAGLATNNTLESLDLTGNPIGNKGAYVLSKAIVTNKEIQKLILIRTKIGDKGMIALSDAIKHNHSLQHLDVRFNQFGDKACTHFADDALYLNNALHTIDFSFNERITHKGWNAIKNVLENYNVTVTQINYHYPIKPHRLQSKISFYLQCNHYGRKKYFRNSFLNHCPNEYNDIWIETILKSKKKALSDDRSRIVRRGKFGQQREDCQFENHFQYLYYFLRSKPDMLLSL